MLGMKYFDNRSVSQNQSLVQLGQAGSQPLLLSRRVGHAQPSERGPYSFTGLLVTLVTIPLSRGCNPLEEVFSPLRSLDHSVHNQTKSNSRLFFFSGEPSRKVTNIQIRIKLSEKTMTAQKKPQFSRLLILNVVLPCYCYRYQPRPAPIPAEAANAKSSAIFQGSTLSAVKSLQRS